MTELRRDASWPEFESFLISLSLSVSLSFSLSLWDEDDAWETGRVAITTTEVANSHLTH